MIIVKDAVEAATWIQRNLQELPIDIRDRFKDSEHSGPSVDMYTAWKMFKAYCGWSRIDVVDGIDIVNKIIQRRETLGEDSDRNSRLSGAYP